MDKNSKGVFKMRKFYYNNVVFKDKKFPYNRENTIIIILFIIKEHQSFINVE